MDNVREKAYGTLHHGHHGSMAVRAQAPHGGQGSGSPWRSGPSTLTKIGQLGATAWVWGLQHEAQR